MRTKEQIIKDREKRFAELQAEAESPAVKRSCESCAWSVYEHWCSEPLVVGLDKEKYGRYYSDERGQPIRIPLCGREKALWKPKPPTLWQRFKEWLRALITQEPTND